MTCRTARILRSPPGRPAALRAAFLHFRKAWGPEAAARLALIRHGRTPAVRLAAFLWLSAARVPLSGAAPSLAFAGLPLPRLT